MERDKRIAVVTDSGTSILPGSPEAKELGVTVVPLALEFYEQGDYAPYSDADISSDDFYRRMKSAEKMLPKTAGAVQGEFLKVFRKLRDKSESILSFNITSRHSGVWESAVQAKNTILDEQGQEININVIDTKSVSRTSAFSVIAASEASKRGASFKDIQDEIAEVIAKSGLFVTLKTLDNFIIGGRGKDLVSAIAASKLNIRPIIVFNDGKLEVSDKIWGGFEKARKIMIEKVGDAGNLLRLAVIHTNAPLVAKITQETLEKTFKLAVPVYEAGPVLAVHAGEGAVGIAFQKA